MGQPAPATADTLPMTNSDLQTNGTSSQPATQHSHIWLITGPAGCGKSTIAQHVAKAMNLPYIEGDEYHPKANVEKMAAGIPLTDADRWDWLTKLREESTKKITSGSQGVVVTCSALKRKYRDVIRVAPYYTQNVLVHFVYLHAPEEVLLARVAARKGHYMGASMVHSQFGILEAPGKDETDIISVDVSGSLDEVEQDALEKIRLAVNKEMAKDS